MARSAPINKRDLPHSVTVFNLYKDPSTGKTAYYSTFLKHVFVMSHKTSLAASIQGQKKLYTIKVMMDARTTAGFIENETGALETKPYKPVDEWRNLDHEGKSRAWTLNEGDWLACRPGEMIIKAADMQTSGLTESQFKQRDGSIKVINAIVPTVDFNGSVHSWGVFLD